MRYFVIFLFYLATFTIMGCGEKPQAISISEEEMVPILRDVHIAEAALQALSSNSRDSMAEVYYLQIFKIHGVTWDDFEQTMGVLREDPIRLERIYEKVMEELAKEDVETEG